MKRLCPCGCINKCFAGRREILCKALLSLMIISVVFCACTKKQIEVQAEAAQAIKELISNFEINPSGCGCHPYISQYLWRNENVYVLAYNDSLNVGYVCDWLPTFYHSNGQKFSLGAANTYLKFLKESRLVTNVWACK